VGLATILLREWEPLFYQEANMLELYVTKTGYESFDALHALGISLFMAQATDELVSLLDCGFAYKLSCSQIPSKDPMEVFNNLFKLPTIHDLTTLRKKNFQGEFLNLDGILAALFTTCGPRAVSVQDMLEKVKIDPKIIEMSYKKAEKAIARWRSFFTSLLTKSARAKFWDDLVTAYVSGTYAIFIPAKHGSINVLMTLEPGLSYSLRQTVSDGIVNRQTNMTVGNLPFAPIFAFLGASRFLRAQRLNNEMVNFYVLIPSNFLIDSKTCLAVISYSSCDPKAASILYSMFLVRKKLNSSCIGIACQTLQTQRAKQSISVDRWKIDLKWLNKFSDPIIKSWILFLLITKRYNIEIDNLTDFLTEQEPKKFLEHLTEWCRMAIYTRSKIAFKGYSLTDLKEITLMIDADHNLPLSNILLSEKGTLRFGHALRQLHARQNGIVQEVIDDLEVVTKQENLVIILSRVLEACVVQDSKYEFTIVPDDKDLFLLLEDVQKFGVRSVASILIILASLRYPRKSNIQSQLANLESKDSERSDYHD
jgi:hypothetical protein